MQLPGVKRKDSPRADYELDLNYHGDTFLVRHENQKRNCN